MDWNEHITQRRRIYPQIVADRDNGMKMKDLVPKYGLSRQRIYKILKKFNGGVPTPKGKTRSLKLGHRRKSVKYGSGSRKVPSRRSSVT